MADKETTYNVPDTTRLYITKNTRSKLYITVFNEDLTRMDLTGGTVWFTVKRRLTDDDSRALIQKTSSANSTIVDPSMGLVKIVIESTETSVFPDWFNNYVYDLVVKDASDNIICTSAGTLGVYPTVTKGAS